MLVDKLKATSGARVFKRGVEKAVELLNKGEEGGDICMGAFVKGMVERRRLCILAWCRGFKNW